MSSSRVFAVGFAALVLANCGGLIKPMSSTEHRNPDINGNKYKTIAVIGGDDTRTTIRMSATVREQLTRNGVNAVRRAGRWASQLEAMNDICKPGEQTVDGVLVVTYNKLSLHDCETKGVAYEIEGGARLGLPEMANKVVVYLKS